MTYNSNVDSLCELEKYRKGIEVLNESLADIREQLRQLEKENSSLRLLNEKLTNTVSILKTANSELTAQVSKLTGNGSGSEVLRHALPLVMQIVLLMV